MALEHLARLMFQGDRKVKSFIPCVHLYVLTDTVRVGGEMTLAMTDLAHACLSNYFSPHGHVCVSWTQREKMRRGLIAQVIGNHTGCMVETIERALQVSQQLEPATAILFLSEDARTFMVSHRTTFLDTLAVCLMTTPERILKLDMLQKPNSI